MKTAYIAKQRQISFVKSHFSRQLEERLGLIEVQAPILSRVGDGTQDNLTYRKLKNQSIPLSTPYAT